MEVFVCNWFDTCLKKLYEQGVQKLPSAGKIVWNARRIILKNPDACLHSRWDNTRRDVKGTFVLSITFSTYSCLEALGKMLVNQFRVKGNENVSTLSCISCTRVWSYTFMHTSCRSNLVKSLDKCLQRECKLGITGFTMNPFFVVLKKKPFWLYSAQQKSSHTWNCAALVHWSQNLWHVTASKLAQMWRDHSWIIPWSEDLQPCIQGLLMLIRIWM